MPRKFLQVFSLLAAVTLVLAACRLPFGSASTEIPALPTPTRAAMEATVTAQPVLTESAPSQAATVTPASSGGELPPFPAGQSLLNDQIQLKSWRPPGNYSGMEIVLPLALGQTANAAVTAGLTAEQLAFLEQNGFVVIHSQEAQFNDIREDVPIRYGQPYFLTTDAAYHALHTTFNEMLKALEAQYLSRQMRQIIEATLAEVLSYQPQVKGTSIEADAQLAAAYLGVALKLFEPDARLEPELEKLIQPQIDQILAGEGKAPSALIPGFEDDYGAYRPVGHYAGKPPLEAYFRGMTWLGRVHFLLKSEDPAFKPSRAPLIITLALRRAKIGGDSAAKAWADVHELLTYLIGPSDDAGPREYAALMDQVYGPAAGIQELADDARWRSFQQRSAELPAPQINSTFVDSLSELEGAKGWRLMGQRFTPDGLIFQNLVFDRVGTIDQPRKLPTGPDVAAVFGSPAALSYLQESGETQYANYPQQMSKLQAALQAQPIAQWLATFYNTWLFAFFPQIALKGTQFPAWMQTLAWGYKELNSMLGSWAELKHDTALYAKMPEGAGGGGPPMSGPAPAYVEPNPDVFYRLGYAARTLGEYLNIKINFEGIELDEPLPGDYMWDGLAGYVNGLLTLGERYEKLGDIAARELAGQLLTAEDYELIQDCLGPVECLVFRSHTPYGIGEIEAPPVPVVAAVAGYENDILEVAVGQVDRIYVVVPLEGRLQIAQGGVFSYYEVIQPRADRLTDEAWRQRLASANPPRRPVWTGKFSLAGGKPVDVLAFRVGDIYLITEEGDQLNLRADHSIKAKIVTRFRTGDYIEIIEGPVSAGNYTWWKVRSAMDETISGWVVENPAWYKRSTILTE